MGKEYSTKYHDMIARCFPDEKFYKLMRRFVFRGGFTHANNIAVNNLFDEPDDEMAGFDRKSSYPASIFHNKMPYQYFDQSPDWFKLHYHEPESFWDDWAFIGAFKFKGLRAKYPHSIESKHKLVDWSSDTVFDNGRVLRGDVYVVLTEYDFLNYRDFYAWDDMKCVWIKTSRTKGVKFNVSASSYNQRYT